MDAAAPTPRRSAHVALGWVVVGLGLGNCVIGARLMERKLGDATEGYVGAAAATLCVAALALVFSRRFRFLGNTEPR